MVLKKSSEIFVIISKIVLLITFEYFASICVKHDKWSSLNNSIDIGVSEISKLFLKLVKTTFLKKEWSRIRNGCEWWTALIQSKSVVKTYLPEKSSERMLSWLNVTRFRLDVFYYVVVMLVIFYQPCNETRNDAIKQFLCLEFSKIDAQGFCRFTLVRWPSWSSQFTRLCEYVCQISVTWISLFHFIFSSNNVRIEA